MNDIGFKTREHSWSVNAVLNAHYKIAKKNKQKKLYSLKGWVFTITINTWDFTITWRIAECNLRKCIAWHIDWKNKNANCKYLYKIEKHYNIQKVDTYCMQYLVQSKEYDNKTRTWAEEVYTKCFALDFFYNWIRCKYNSAFYWISRYFIFLIKANGTFRNGLSSELAKMTIGPLLS